MGGGFVSLAAVFNVVTRCVTTLKPAARETKRREERRESFVSPPPTPPHPILRSVRFRPDIRAVKKRKIAQNPNGNACFVG